MDDPDTLLTTREAAALLRLSERTMERQRTAGTGPKFRKFSKAIRYSRRDILEFIDVPPAKARASRPDDSGDDPHAPPQAAARGVDRL
jgi:predicted DNA-binding transcriptional regulator AlpA